MALMVMWALRDASGHEFECQLRTPEYGDHMDLRVHVALVRGGEAFRSEWFDDYDDAIERTISLYRELKDEGWQE